MRCPYCAGDDDRVVDSRAAEAGAAVRRRRQCLACGRRFSTYERVEHAVLAVRKRSGATEPFHREKVLAGIVRATGQRPTDSHALRRIVARVEARIRSLGLREVPSEVIGSEVLEALREFDPVAYVRFASVYRQFTNPDDFVRELARLDKHSPPEPAGEPDTG